MKRNTVTIALTSCFLLALAIGASHAATPWRISGVYLESCSCDIPCPCATGSGPPTNGTCQGVLSLHIKQGIYGDVILAYQAPVTFEDNDLDVVIMVDIPGMPNDGNWTIATYISESASPIWRRSALPTGMARATLARKWPAACISIPSRQVNFPPPGK